MVRAMVPLLLIALAACASGPGTGLTAVDRLFVLLPAEAGAAAPVAGLFTTDRPLILTLEADLHQLLRDRDQDTEERPARVLLPLLDGDTLDIRVNVRTRGTFRLSRGICAFPPLRINFPTRALAGTILEGQDKLKLVTHCQEPGRYEQDLLEEYLVYRIYNLLTDSSFRVQLAFIRYVDTGGRNEPIFRFAFFIEDEDRMAERLGGTMVGDRRVPYQVYDPQHAGILNLFQYMIGNTDWSMVAQHNVKTVQAGEGYLPVPYDFDFSGLVDAPYAGPHPDLVQFHRTVRHRLFRGGCRDDIDYGAVIALFNAREGEIVDLVRAPPGLSEGNAASAAAYVAGFFRELRDPERFRSWIPEVCVR
jgi:hypothetical protein